MGYKKIEIKVTAGPNASNKAKVMERKINKIAISVLVLILSTRSLNCGAVFSLITIIKFLMKGHFKNA